MLSVLFTMLVHKGFKFYAMIFGLGGSFVAGTIVNGGSVGGGTLGGNLVNLTPWWCWNFSTSRIELGRGCKSALLHSAPVIHRIQLLLSVVVAETGPGGATATAFVPTARRTLLV